MAIRARLLEGDRPGTIVEADADVVACWLASGKAELVEPEKPETPESSSRRRSPKSETRG